MIVSTLENELLAAGGQLLRPEYLVRQVGTPFLPLSLESIGDNLRMAMKHKRARLSAREFRLASRDFAPHVRRIVGVDRHGQLQWANVRGNRSHAEANSRGTRGVFVHYILERGPIYDINAPRGWRKVDRYFVRFQGDGHQRMTIAEVLSCLAR